VISFGPDDDPEDILKQAKERANLMVNYTKIFYEDWENGVDRVKAEIKEYKNKFNDVELKLKKLI
jgi:predicted  nucleic acid-binding Zn-ribbon protein